MTYRYYELIDDLGQDFYRVDDDTGEVETWACLDDVWYYGDLTSFEELEWIAKSTYTSKFEEVTEDDVR